MKKLFLLLFAMLPLYVAFAQSGYNPKADIRAIVKEKYVRFTVLTPRMIRMEWSAGNTFIDDASFVFVNRKLPFVHFTQTEKDGWLIITTDELELRYKLKSGKFTGQNLSVKYLHPQNSFTWIPGMVQKNNLKGTYRTLDGCDGDVHAYNHKPIKLEDGLLATDGWTMIDDSNSLLFDNSEWAWVKQRPGGEKQDWYFMGYGDEYKKALYDYTLVAGKVPLPPRYAFGYWWSRYWSYSDNEVRDMVANFEKYNIPLDVFVIDMDWHLTDSLKSGHRDEFGEGQQWTGWTWNKRLFPEPNSFLHWMKDKSLKTTFNLHPASGIASYEAPYKEFAKRMNFDTSSHKNIPYIGSDKKFMQTLFDVVLHPMEKEGVSFWWLDWQQWLNDKKVNNLSNTWWLNYVFFSDKERNSDQRPMLYHRWGGLGNHRYQIGFSGDAIISWNSLAFQPYFTNCASNVLYGYWSHDIGGHMFSPDSAQYFNPELYVRWMQFGALSPIFRTHSTKNAVLNKEIWNFRGEFFNALNNAVHLRYELNPYIYTMARKTFDSAISLCRPLYYDYPEAKEAFEFKSQYMFGDNILVAPVSSPMVNGSTKVKVWLPAGNDWYEWNTGTLLKGDEVVEREFTLEEYPVYVKAGSIIPMYTATTKRLDNAPDKTILAIFPKANGATEIYEDGGNSKNYATEFATTKVMNELKNRKQTIAIYPRKGHYAQMPESRTYVVKLYGVEMPQSITVNGKKINYTQIEDEKEWSYDGKTLSVNIPLLKINCSVKQTVEVEYSKKDSVDVNTGLVKKFRELSKAITGLKYKDAGIILPETVGRCEETNLRLQYYPAGFYETLKYFNDNYSKIPEAVRSSTNKDAYEWLINEWKIK